MGRLRVLFKKVLSALATLRRAPHAGASHTRDASGLRCRNCGGVLDYTDIACPSCGRRITRFTLRT